MILTRISPSPLEPSATLSYTDLEVGIPLLLASCELVIFSVFFHFAYSVTPYRLTSSLHKPPPQMPSDDRIIASGSYYGGPLGVRAWISMLNPTEFISAITFGLRMRKEVMIREHGSDQTTPLNAFEDSREHNTQFQPQQNHCNSNELHSSHHSIPPRYGEE